MLEKLEVNSEKSNNAIFAKKLISYLTKKYIRPKPIDLATALNKHYKTTSFKPHTVRKWLLGLSLPRSETMLLLANWLKVDPKDLISKPDESVNSKVTFEFDYTDQEVISKYLAMSVKQKVAVRLVIDAIAEKRR